METVVTVGLLCTLILSTVLHFTERRDLYDRIMAKSFTEYKQEPHENVRSAHRRVLDRWEGKE